MAHYADINAIYSRDINVIYNINMQINAVLYHYSTLILEYSL